MINTVHIYIINTVNMTGVWMYVCMDVCVYGCVCVWMYVCMDVCVYECMCVWMYVCMDVCVYGCMCVCPPRASSTVII